MAPVEIYTTKYCPYCTMAKDLLAQKGVRYMEYHVDRERGLRQKMVERSMGRYAVPQIFIRGEHVGGFDDLSALDRKGRLDGMLHARA